MQSCEKTCPEFPNDTGVGWVSPKSGNSLHNSVKSRGVGQYREGEGQSTCQNQQFYVKLLAAIKSRASTTVQSPWSMGLGRWFTPLGTPGNSSSSAPRPNRSRRSRSSNPEQRIVSDSRQ